MFGTLSSGTLFGTLEWDLACAYFPRRPRSRLKVILIATVPVDSLDGALLTAARSFLEDEGHVARS